MIFIAQVKKGKLKMTDYMSSHFQDFLKKNEGARVHVEPVTIESKKIRKFYHGAVIPLIAYLNNLDFKNSSVRASIHEYLKIEFNGELIEIGGNVRKIGKTTRNQLNSGFLEGVIQWVEEQYGLNRKDVLDSDEYFKWRDELYPFTDCPETFIEYLKSLNKLK